MRNKILSFFILSAGVCLLLIFGCDKNHLRSGTQPANMHLVSQSVARSMAIAFNPTNFYHSNNPSNHSPYKSTLLGKNSIDREFVIKDSLGNPAIYVFNFTGDQGALLISADSGIAPILGFIEHGSFDPARLASGPGGLRNWLGKTIDNFRLIRTGLYDNSSNAAPAWKKYALVNAGPEGTAVPLAELHHGNITPDNPPVNNPCAKGNTYTTVGPLLPVTWGQECNYDEQCPNFGCVPINNCGEGFAPTGCVATAMAQIIRYWGIVDAYNYNYAIMPATTGNAEVQRLMANAGTNVGMTYGCGGSGAAVNSIPAAMNAFGFTSGGAVSSFVWQEVEGNIYDNEPVIFSGFNDQYGLNGHAWVCDGLMDEEYVVCDNGVYEGGGELLDWHMNWGWNEEGVATNYNGWFQYTNWAPGNGENWQYAQQMVWGIHP